MKTDIFVWADHGDSGGSVEEVLITTSEKLTESNLPNLEEAEVSSRFITTESWAYISWLSDKDFKNQEDGPSTGMGVEFYSEGGDAERVWASYWALSKALLEVVKSGEYIEKIYHSGSEAGRGTDFIYELDCELF